MDPVLTAPAPAPRQPPQDISGAASVKTVSRIFRPCVCVCVCVCASVCVWHWNDDTTHVPCVTQRLHAYCARRGRQVERWVSSSLLFFFLSQGSLSFLSCDDYVALFWSEVPQPYAGLVLALTSALFIALTILSTFHFGKLGPGLCLSPSPTLTLKSQEFHTVYSSPFCTTASLSILCLYTGGNSEISCRFENTSPPTQCYTRVHTRDNNYWIISARHQ